jgi:hypothetical protein
MGEDVVIKVVGLMDLPLIAWGIFYTVRYHLFRKRVQGLKEPELWLPRKERQAHARKLLKREDDEYDQKFFERMDNYIKRTEAK